MATPICDANEFYAGDEDGGQEAVPADVAQQLEEALNAAVIRAEAAERSAANAREGLTKEFHAVMDKLDLDDFGDSRAFRAFQDGLAIAIRSLEGQEKEGGE